MYNTELKEKFIKEYTDSVHIRRSLLSLFNATEKYEEEWGADICTKTASELKDVAEDIIGFRASSTTRISLLRNYVEWCINNNVPGACDGALNLTTNGLGKLKREMVRNPRHLQKYLDDICSPESYCTADNAIRCYYWLAYAGMKEEDIFKVTGADVNFNDMVVEYNNEAYPLYRESLPAFKNCVYLKEFVYIHPNYPPVKRERVEGDILIRGFRSTPTVGTMRVELSRRSRKYFERCRKNGNEDALKLSHYRVWLSGVFYRFYEDELAGIKPNFKALVDMVSADKVYKLDSGRNTQSAKRRKLACEYSTDYKRWKMTFTQ